MNRLETYESYEPMDHLPHPLPRPSQTTRLTPKLHRLARPSALRPQRRLLGRILRRGSPHRAPADLRGYLCTLALRPMQPTQLVRGQPPSAVPRPRSIGPRRNSGASPDLAAEINEAEGNFPAAPDPGPALAFASPNSQVSPASPRPSPICDGKRERGTGVLRRRAHRDLCADNRSCGDSLCRLSSGPEVSGRGRSSQSASPAFHKTRELPQHQPSISLCECSINSPCGKSTSHPSIKPVIAGCTTYGIYLLTATIRGSNFAIP